MLRRYRDLSDCQSLTLDAERQWTRRQPLQLQSSGLHVKSATVGAIQIHAASSMQCMRMCLRTYRECRGPRHLMTEVHTACVDDSES